MTDVLVFLNLLTHGFSISSKAAYSLMVSYSLISYMVAHL